MMRSLDEVCFGRWVPDRYAPILGRIQVVVYHNSYPQKLGIPLCPQVEPQGVAAANFYMKCELPLNKAGALYFCTL